jgi:hypothetical protein
MTRNERPAGPWIVAALVVALVLLPALYVLSVGPCIYFYGDTSGLSFYEPLRWARERSPALGRWLHWYVGHWT